MHIMFALKLLTSPNVKIVALSSKFSANGLLWNKHLIRLYFNYSENERKGSLKSTPSNAEVNTNVKSWTYYGERAKENAKTASYLGVIVFGIGVTSIMFLAIVEELLTKKSPNSVYSKTLRRCISDQRIEDALGVPIKAYGEESRRGRRGHVAHTSFTKDADNFMQMMFHLQGTRGRANVHLEVKENERGDWEYQYLYVVLDNSMKRTIILEDNYSQIV